MHSNSVLGYTPLAFHAHTSKNTEKSWTVQVFQKILRVAVERAYVSVPNKHEQPENRQGNRLIDYQDRRKFEPAWWEDNK